MSRCNRPGRGIFARLLLDIVPPGIVLLSLSLDRSE
jgi:hypothetical protein